jgi:hypothetical protein
MTFIRRKALEISSWVTWLASPGCKEWAEGLEREVAFIDSDWRALGWAIGSARLLLEPQEAPLRSLVSYFSSGAGTRGCQSSTRLPSGSVIQAKRP